MAPQLPNRPLLPHPEGPTYHSHVIHHGVFTPRQCARIVQTGLAQPVATGGLESEGGEVLDLRIRNSRTAWLVPGDETDWIYSKLASVAQRTNRRYGFDLTGFEENLQFSVYDMAGAFYTWHQDGLDGPVAHRKLSLVVQLSDPADYEGAELQLFDVVEDYDSEELGSFVEESSRQGSVIVFPSIEYHRVVPLRSGTRYSLVSWVSGPPFR